MQYITRQQWGARPPKAVNPVSRSEGIFVHHSVTPEGGAAVVRQIQNMHMDQRGWLDIAYSWLVDKDGNIYEGRGWGVAGGHTQGWNSKSHAVCYIGNTENGLPPQAALKAINVVIAEHQARYGGFVKGHRDVNATACPGSHLYNWINAGRPTTGSPVPPPPTPPVVVPKPQPPAPKPKPPRAQPTLQRGSVGANVKLLQTHLKAFDQQIAADGVFGPQTKRAVENFQRFWGLGVDGIYGPKTAAMMDFALSLKGL